MKRPPHPAVVAAARFIAPWEGFLPVAVADELAGGLPTQGYGHTKFAGKPLPSFSEVWSKAKALRVLAHDAMGASRSVSAVVKRRIPMRVRMALISAVFNLGPSFLDGDILAAVNTGHYSRAAELLEHFDHDGAGNVILGLERRRKAEAWMLRNPHKVSRNPHKPHPKKRRK